MWDMKHVLAATGTTGNNTHTSYKTGAGYGIAAFEFIVEAVGATPTVTWKIQGSMDNDDVADGSSAWYDLGYITDSSDTIAVSTRTATAVGRQIIFLANPVARKYNKFRLVTTANTNVTYRCEARLYPK